MIRRPPSSTPFPYTSLFQSPLLPVSSSHATIDAAVSDGSKYSASRTTWPLALLIVPPVPTTCLPAEQEAVVSFSPDESLDDDADRKSTRLNSSHANISYAVF